MSVAAVAPHDRHSRAHPCPICGGSQSDPRGVGRRCTGYSSDGWARCSREEHAGSLPLEDASGAYVHRLSGECRCGTRHGEPEAGREIVYEYETASRAVARRVHRLDLPGGKRIWQSVPGGGRPGDAPRTLYRLPEILAAAPSEIVWVPEGEKCAEILRDLGLVATTSAGGCGMAPREWTTPGYCGPLRGRHVVVLPDDDAPGAKYAELVAARVSEVAASVRVLALPGSTGGGYNVADWLADGHTADELRALVESAPTWSPDAAASRSESAPGLVPERPEISIDVDESRVADEAIAALALDGGLYVRGGTLVEVICDDPVTRGLVRGGPTARIAPCAEARVREILSRVAAWVGPDGGGGMRPAHPPQWLVRAVMARGRWPGIRPITAVATAPTMRPDGSLLVEPRYDPSTGIYLASSLQIEIPGRPTLADARAAVASLLDVVADFPAAPAAKSAFLSGLISIVARPAIDGPIPMFLVDASVRGSGKSLLVDVAAMIATGRPAPRMIYSRGDAEVRKTITSIALVGDPVVLLDNVVGELGCASLDAALTADTWRDRVLGASQMTTEIPLRMVWWATGNGMSVGADLVRRSLLIRLEPSCERPEERSGWRHPRLLEYVREHRGRLIAAALTIVRGYVTAGRPRAVLTPIGSYEAWSDLPRQALVWAGQPDPVMTVADLRAADARDGALRAALAAWPDGAGEEFTAAELVKRAAEESSWRVALTEWVPARGGDLPTSRSLGYALRNIRGRIVDGTRIESRPDRNGIARWRLDRLTAGDAGDEGHPAPIGHDNPPHFRLKDRYPASPASPAPLDLGGDR